MMPAPGAPDRPSRRKRLAARPANDRVLRLLRLSHIFSSAVRDVLQVKLLREAGPDSLSLSQFHFLKMITLCGDCHIGEVAGFLGVSPPAATKTLDKLEALGLIVRNPVQGDRRAVALAPTPEGHRTVRRYEAAKSARLKSTLGRFRASDLDRFAQFLERFSLCLVRQDDSNGKHCFRCAGHCEPDCAIGRLKGGCPYQKPRALRPRLGGATA